MRDDQRTTQMHDRRPSDAKPARSFARRLECGGDGRTGTASTRAAWPAGRAPGAVREGVEHPEPGDDAPDAR